MSKKYSRRRLQSIGDILFSVLKKRGLAASLEENTLFKFWPEAVGAKIAAQTQPAGWRAGTLFVKTTSSVWVQQLHFMKDDIRQKINNLAGKTSVRDIHFIIGFSPEPNKFNRGLSESKKIVLNQRDKKMIAECTEALADRELAEIVQRVMKKEISRRRLSEKQPAR